MLGLQGNSSSSKEYRCVACSATFTGLASLLVHQATHANSLAKISTPPPVQPTSLQHDMVTQNKDLSNQRTSSTPLLPECPAPSSYICECGEEFQDFNLMLQHKRSHISAPQLSQPLNSNVFHSIKEDSGQVRPPQPEEDLVLNKGVTDTNTTQDQSKSHPDSPQKEPQSIATTQEPNPKQDLSVKEKVSSSAQQNLPNNRLMKLLATTYMKHLQPHQFSKQSKKQIIPKTEVVPVAIAKATTTDGEPNTEAPVVQLRELLKKAVTKTKAPAVGKILDSSKKSIVSLTKTFSPVVLLETRQKFIDSNGNGKCGMYQCGRCRKVFQNIDSLTEHHFLHRKERIKCCRHCKQLIIGKLPFPDNHVCPQVNRNAMQHSRALQNKSALIRKLSPFHNIRQHSTLNSAKKVFYCPSCKHSYSRRYNLKMHKCQGPASSLSQHATFHSSEDTQSMRSLSVDNTDVNVSNGPQMSQNVAVSTEVIGRIKVEGTPANAQHPAYTELAWPGSAKSFPPFYPSTGMPVQKGDASPRSSSLQQQEGESKHSAAAPVKEDNEGQWTVPLDDETEVLSAPGETHNDTESKGTTSATNANAVHPTGLPFFIRDGVKRFPCNRCQKTYSRSSTLRRHLRLCGFRPHGFAVAQQSNGEVENVLGAMPQLVTKPRPIFNCTFCGKTFNRKDNMLTHRKRCQLKNTGPEINSGTLQPSFSGSASEGQSQQQDEGTNWGIMSLPSVLPRRVTCECGAGFTSPRLLLEHLQKHAQESYTCPTCGETVSSWADYEVHLQIHMHPHHHLYKGLKPQRSQPLLLRFQQQPSQQQPSQLAPQPPLKHPAQLLNKKQQRITCTRCNNTFSSRCSLRRHISLNRCKGGRVMNPPKTNHCSRCNTDFPNVISLMFHQRSGACKPAIKPVRCHFCFRWFGTVDGLQKHLLTHRQSESYRCDVCQGTYPNLKSLKNHRRRIHRIMAGDIV